MSANRQEFKLRSDSEARKAANKVIQWVIRTPSAVDKLPRYIIEEVDMMQYYADKNGWGFLEDE